MASIYWIYYYFQDNLRNHLAELFFLENEGNLLDLSLWSSNSNPYLENYIQQIKCASTDALGELLELVPTGTYTAPLWISYFHSALIP